MTRSGQKGFQVCANGPPPTGVETANAISRMETFPFVGITEEWDLSICLFRKMFGGQCVGSDFLNMRKTNARATDQSREQAQHDLEFDLELETGAYPTDVLNGYTDKYD